MEKNIQNRFYVETYGCQMNLSDTEIIQGLLIDSGYVVTKNANDANIILINTCSVREHAEERVLQRIRNFKQLKAQKSGLLLGVIGCMAERLKERLFEIDESIDLILGPDDYRKLPQYILQLKTDKKIHDTDANYSETYDDIVPYRSGSVSAWIPIMRGCNNFCSYCVVPYTRGEERSKPFSSIINESKDLISKGYKEIYLLGQNVNSYFDEGKDFSDLITAVSKLAANIRIRFMTSNPKDLSNKLIKTIMENENICKYIHLPFQSGSNKILKLMNRNYTRESYLELIHKIKSQIPDIGLSTDIIIGFPTETEADYEGTIDLLDKVHFDSAFTFKYSPREGTEAFNLMDDVSPDVKRDRLEKIISLQQKIALSRNMSLLQKNVSVIIECESKKSKDEFQGRLDNNKVTVFPKGTSKIGDFVEIKITKVTSATLIGQIV